MICKVTMVLPGMIKTLQMIYTSSRFYNSPKSMVLQHGIALYNARARKHMQPPPVPPPSSPRSLSVFLSLLFSLSLMHRSLFWCALARR